jgi:hypothetical protein
MTSHANVGVDTLALTHPSTVGAGEVTGRWKALGYEAQELTQVMNRWAAARTPPQRSQP